MTELNSLLSVTYKLKDGEHRIDAQCVASQSGEEGVVVNADPSKNVAGVLRDEGGLEAGNDGTFQVAGIAKLKAAEQISIGDMLVVSDSKGRVKPKGVGAHANANSLVGRAISAATTPDSWVKCILTIPNEYSE